MSKQYDSEENSLQADNKGNLPIDCNIDNTNTPAGTITINNSLALEDDDDLIEEDIVIH
ncbi:MAG: hypothetical protein RCG15_02680 [Candidatus Rickettsia vulgarisii]